MKRNACAESNVESKYAMIMRRILHPFFDFCFPAENQYVSAYILEEEKRKGSVYQ